MNNLVSKKLSKKKEFRALGTDIFLEIVFGDSKKEKKAQADLEAVREIFFAKEKVFSRFDPQSELCRINSHTRFWREASRDILYLAKRALCYNKISGGLFDPRIIDILEGIGYKTDFRQIDFSKNEISGNFRKIENHLGKDLKIRGEKIFFGRRMDFSGIAKGYIVDQAASFLKKSGWENFLVDAGGDMNISGLNSADQKWCISIEGVPEGKLMLELSNCGVATSGISRKKWTTAGKKYHHLVNPKNPNHFSCELQTVSVIARKAEEADGRAKTLVLMGREKGKKFAEKNKIAAIFLDYRGNVLVSPAAKKYVLAHSL